MSRATIAADDSRLPVIVERIKAGGALIAESKRLGFTHNGQLRTALRAYLGNDAYRAVLKASMAQRDKTRSATGREGT